MPTRKRRIALGGELGPTLSFTPAQKAAVEKAYGRAISADVWNQLTEITNIYLSFAAREKTATPTNIIIEKLKRLKKDAESLRGDLSSVPLVPSQDLERIVQKYFRRTDLETAPGELRLNGAVLHCLDAVLDLTSYAIEHYSRPQEREHHRSPEGSWWLFWVVCLEKILGRAGLPTGVRKDRNKQKRDRASPFVLFVHAIQGFLPAKLRAHMPSSNSSDQTIYLDALSQAINRARRSMRWPNAVFEEDMLHLWTSILTGTGTNTRPFPVTLKSRNWQAEQAIERALRLRR